ncbi:MAG: DUF72 domain-containing protein [Actinomycetota bacterium]|nr:DUF72 domain-containing protein [Actinomycetota bacterium]
MLHVGTSGWQYRDWRGVLYPDGLPVRRWLEHYVGAFATVEVNNTFYRLPPTETFATWFRSLPPDFVMALKVSRYLTHLKRLAEPAEPVARFLERSAPLGPRLGPVLLQLPPNLAADRPRLADTLDRFPSTCRVAVEVRHPSWFDDRTAGLLAERNAALCLTDRGSRVTGPLWRTADWGYVRFHEGRARPRPCYGDTALGHWAERLAERWPEGEDVFAYFNNDPRGCAVRDAVRFAHLARRAGLQPSRVPRVLAGPVES